MSEEVFEGNGFLWVILIFLFFLGFNGGGLFGGNNATTASTVSNDMSQVERDVLNNGFANEKATMTAQYDSLLNTKDLSASMASCCCDIKTTIHAEGEATRALITQNRIADLQDQLDTARAAVANSVQTQNILNALGKYVPYLSTGTTIQ